MYKNISIKCDFGDSVFKEIIEKQTDISQSITAFQVSDCNDIPVLSYDQ